MTDVFLKAAVMGISAGWLILAVLLLRLLMKRAPKWMNGILWALVAIRLLCPFSIQSAYALFPSLEKQGAHVLEWADEGAAGTWTFAQGTSGYDAAKADDRKPVSDGDAAVVSAADRAGESLTVKNKAVFVLAWLWVTGIFGMAAYAVAGVWRIKRRVRTAVFVRDNIYRSDNIAEPFVFGLLRPRIYLPSAMEHADMEHVIAHEQAHIRRRDYLTKPFGFALLAVYWFQPLCWVAYRCFCRDMELACDARAVCGLDAAGRVSYSQALLHCSTSKKIPAAGPLFFGEPDVKERMKHVLYDKKPAFWVILLSLLACAVMAVCFLTTSPDVQDSAAEQDEDEMLTLDAYNDKYGTTGASGEEKLTLDEYNDKYGTTGASGEEKLTLDAYNDTYRKDAQSVAKEGGADAPDSVQTVSTLDQAITDAVLMHNKPDRSQAYDFACCSFVKLKEDDTKTATMTVYGWALYQAYNISDEGIEDVCGSHIPVVLTFDTDENGYSLREYWEPRDGSYYVQDIQKKFPKDIAADGIDSQKFILRQIQDCYQQAIAYSGIDTEKIFNHLIDAICASPAGSSNPQDYIDAHPIEYRELKYYGEYTHKHSLAHFLSDESGLKVSIMHRVCEEMERETMHKVHTEEEQKHTEHHQ